MKTKILAALVGVALFYAGAIYVGENIDKPAVAGGVGFFTGIVVTVAAFAIGKAPKAVERLAKDVLADDPYVAPPKRKQARPIGAANRVIDIIGQEVSTALTVIESEGREVGDSNQVY